MESNSPRIAGCLGFLGLAVGFCIAFALPVSFWIPLRALPLEAKAVIAWLFLCASLAFCWIAFKVGGGK